MQWIDFLISSVLALVMFGIGASLEFRDFTHVFKPPKSLILGLSLQMIFLPALAFGVVLLTDLNPILKVGLIIVSFCPGGTNSNFISYIVNADVPLSIALTTVNSVLILFTIPLYTNLSLEYFLGKSNQVSLSLEQAFGQVFLLILFPALLGLGFRRLFHRLAERLEKPLKRINIALLAIIYSIKFFGSEENGGSGISPEAVFAILPGAAAIHLLSMLASYALARWIFRSNNLTSTTIGIEVGLQNTTLAILITGTILGNNEMTQPALVVALFSFFTTLLFALITTNFRAFRSF